MNTNQPSTKRVDVIASLSMESLIRSLELPFNLRFASNEFVSLETQQMDEHQKLEILEQHHENLKKLLKAEKPTGTPHLFVLDPELLAVGDVDAGTTLQAFANQQFSNSSRAAVAMLAPANGYTVAGQAAASMLKDSLVKDMGVISIESVDELVAWLNTL